MANFTLLPRELRDQICNEFLADTPDPEARLHALLTLRTVYPEFSSEILGVLNLTIATTASDFNAGPAFTFGSLCDIRYAPGITGMSVSARLIIRTVTLHADDFDFRVLRTVKKDHVFPRTYDIYFDVKHVFRELIDRGPALNRWRKALKEIMSQSDNVDYVELQPITLRGVACSIRGGQIFRPLNRGGRILRDANLAEEFLRMLVGKIKLRDNWRKSTRTAGDSGFAYELAKIDDHGKVLKIVKINPFILLEAART